MSVLAINQFISSCLHCGQVVPTDRKDYCCQGCEIVSRLLKEADLSRFYDLKPKRLSPQINYFTRRPDFSWIDTLSGLKNGYVMLDLEGLQCTACVWVVQEVARRLDPGTRVDVDLVLGRISLVFNPEHFSLLDYAGRLFKLGYRLKRRSDAAKNADDGLLLRLGVCAAVAMNTMFLAIAIYAGLKRSEPQLFELINRINFYLTFITVIVGGGYFFQKAYLTLRQGILHFDLTISIGILAAFTGSVFLHLSGRGDESYFDTVNIFITLMLAGRFIQERVVAKNRNAMLIQDELAELKVLRVGEQIQPVGLKEVQQGDILLLQVGGLVPVTSRLMDAKADFSLNWISGESMPVTFITDQTIPAGAQLATQSSVKVLALESFEHSPVRELQPKNKEETVMSVVWQWVVARYVILVLVSAVSGYIAWSYIDPSKALNVLTAILVVTCPCSLGVAIPMARVMADYSLRRRGVFIRGSSVLDKLTQVKNVFFDKTGTLTLAVLEWTNQEAVLLSLNSVDRQLLFSMVLQSRHPASLSVYQSLTDKGITALDVRVTEIPGKGLLCQYNGNEYAFGSFYKEFQETQMGQYVVGFFKNDSELVSVILEEKVLDRSRETLDYLHQRGLRSYLLSGDKAERVKPIAERLGIDSYYGNLLPEDKAVIVRRVNKDLLKDESSLVIGDGLNDAKAFEAATIAGTPIWDYSAMAQGADFYYISGSLSWLNELFKTAYILKNTIRMNLTFSLLFNLCAIGFALSGKISPLVAAIIMPVGSIGILSLTMNRMRQVNR